MDYECDEYLDSLRERCRKRQHTGTVNSLLAQIARLKRVRDDLHQRFVPVGAGYGQSRQHTWMEIETAFRNRLLTGAVLNSNHIDPREFLEDAESTVIEKISDVMTEHGSVKVSTAFHGEFVAGEKREVMTIATKNSGVYRTTDLHEWYAKRVVETILAKLEEFQERDSGWALSRILDLHILVNKFNPMHAGCHIDLPQEIMMKRAVVNVRSTDNACFARAVVAALYPAEKDSGRVSQYPHYATKLNLCGIEFPMTLPQIASFEKLNAISVNVFTVEEKSVVPLRLTSNKQEKHVNLLYVLGNNNEAHFACIKDLSRLVSSQLSKRNGKKYMCDR